MKQILMLGGGMSFESREKAITFFSGFDIDYPKKSRSWKDWLAWSLEDTHEMINVQFPCRDNADYELWRIVFEKYLPRLQDDVIIVAHSLGTIFIMKYLCENKFPMMISQVHLVSPIVADEFQSIDDVEQTGTFSFDYGLVSKIASVVPEIHLWHSRDDDSCDFKNIEYLYLQFPDAVVHEFIDRGHMNQSTFPEMFDHLR